MHAAVELNGPLYAEVRTTADVIDGIKTARDWVPTKHDWLDEPTT